MQLLKLPKPNHDTSGSNKCNKQGIAVPASLWLRTHGSLPVTTFNYHFEMNATDHSQILRVRTLGPTGTNLEAAAKWWCQARSATNAEVVLHDTLEQAVDEMVLDGTEVLIGCVVYPELHTLVFSNLDRLEISECFVYPTFRMVLASRDGKPPTSVATHPAPRLLVPQGTSEVVIVNSNSVAALACASGTVEGCVTTLVAAQSHGLHVLKDYGVVPMGFSVHSAKSVPVASVK